MIGIGIQLNLHEKKKKSKKSASNIKTDASTLIISGAANEWLG